MCLIPKKKGDLQEVIEVSDKDILVWKKLYIDQTNGSIITPYRRSTVDGPWLEAYTFSAYTHQYSEMIIAQGIHSYTKKVVSKMYLVVPSTIPAGTPFIRGNSGDIVSLFLLLGRW